MRIAFFGKEGSFDYTNIGGTNSLTRRFAEELVEVYGHHIDFIHYGVENKKIFHSHNFNSCYYKKYSDAITSLLNYDHVLLIYVPLTDLLPLYFFCKHNKNTIQFHNLYQDWPESFLIRNIMFYIKGKLPINGFNIGISDRIFKKLSSNVIKSIHLWPPVPNSYFKKIDGNSVPSTIRVAFIGRLDVGKGILETLEIFENLAAYPLFEIKLFGIHWDTDPIAVKTHDQLTTQKVFQYYPAGFKNYTPQIDEMVRDALFNTDIFLQPYRKLSSTIDTPLLMLEAMASLCAVITKPYGNIPEIYGSSPCLIDGPDFVEEATNLILQSKNWLNAEKKRIIVQNQMLNFDTTSAGKSFVRIILNDPKDGV